LVTAPRPGDDDSGIVDPVPIAGALQVAKGFSLRRRIDGPLPGFRGAPVLALAAIARPERFFADLSATGWSVAGTIAFRDHHAFTAADVSRIGAEARRLGAELVVTTEKDAVRFKPADVTTLRLWPVPLTIEIEPADAFRDWLLGRLGAAHQAPSSAPGSGAAPHRPDPLLYTPHPVR
jgi:tetraacyldisaccharide-1-P 4'-kinase